MAENERQRDKLLPPGTFAHALDGTTAQIKTYVGPVSMSLTGQDRAVRYNPETGRFDEVNLDQAVQQIVVIPEGSYGVLRNPSRDASMRPQRGKGENPAELLIGETENLKGPQALALWPMQSVEVRKGHHLRSNEYLLISVYSDEKARANWSQAVIKAAEGAGPATDSVLAKAAPTDLAMGKKYNILGTEVSFYIPPTGVEVVAEATDDKGRPIFVRDAETLEQLEYAILVDEDGNKEYPKGPRVVFPKPTQQFMALRDKKGQPVLNDDGTPVRKFRAIEMNPLQGIQLKFMKVVDLKFADGTSATYKAGDEVFITGAQMPIYYPEEGHQLVTYDGKTIHYATQISEGEGKYLLDRISGKVDLVRGPQMLLPNPVTHTIAYRPLSERESRVWFPGADGKGSPEALEWNRRLRAELEKSPTTRTGVVSEGQMERGPGGGGQGFGAVDALAANYTLSGAVAVGAVDASSSAAMDFMGTRQAAAPQRVKASQMAMSRQGKDQQAVVGDVAERRSTYHEPRAIILGTKMRGVPTVNVYPGYAVSVADPDGSRHVVKGPKTVLLEFSQRLDMLRLSTGKPKKTDALFDTAYLNISNNKVTDVIEDVETSDHVLTSLKLVYNVNFEGDESKWFTIENYVKYLCDHVRSIVKGKVKKLSIEQFYASATDILRDIILGVAPPLPGDADKNAAPSPTSRRPGLAFPANGMRVTDVEVLQVAISDPNIASLLTRSQLQVVSQNISLSLAERQLEVTRRQEIITQETTKAKFETERHQLAVQKEKDGLQLGVRLAQIDAALREKVEQKKVIEAEDAIAAFSFEAELERQLAAREQEMRFATSAQEIQLAGMVANSKAIIEQLQAIQPGLIEALQSAGARETLVQVARELSFHTMFGAENGVDFIRKVFEHSPLQSRLSDVIGKAAALVSPNGNGGKASSPNPAT